MRGWPVSRILSRELPPMDDHSSAAPVTRAVKLPTRTSGLKRPCGGLCCRRRLAPLAVADLSTQGPYSALLRVGLAVPSRLPGPRWALTPPFHHHPCVWQAKRLGSLFSVALSLGLPPPGVTRHPCFMESGLSSIPDQVRDRGHPAIRARRWVGFCSGRVNMYQAAGFSMAKT